MSRNIAQELSGSGGKAQWGCAAVSGAAVSTFSEQTKPSHSTLAQEVRGWEGSVALPAALWLPLQPRTAVPCVLSQLYPLASVAKQQLRHGSVASDHSKRLWLGLQ